MLDKLKSISERLDAVNEKLMDPEVITDQDQYKKYMKEHKNLSLIVEKYHEFLTVKGNVDEARGLMDENLEPDFREIVEEEYKTGKERLEVLEEEIKILLLPRDPNDDKNVIVEIRGGAGGEESALFANSLYRMYSMYAEKKGYKVEVLSLNETELGGIKEISFSIEGEGAYSRKATKVILTAVKRQQLAELKALVVSVDPDAFIIVQEAHQVLGDGFSRYSKDAL